MKLNGLACIASALMIAAAGFACNQPILGSCIGIINLCFQVSTRHQQRAQQKETNAKINHLIEQLQEQQQISQAVEQNLITLIQVLVKSNQSLDDDAKQSKLWLRN